MASVVVDRRRQITRDRRVTDRVRLVRRLRRHVRDALRKKLIERSVVEVDRQGETVRVPIDAVREYMPGYDPRTGEHDHVLAGNDRFRVGDRIPKPPGGAGGGAGEGHASPDGQGEDDFVFEVDREEFLQFFFEDLELPDLARRELARTEAEEVRFRGLTDQGPPSAMDVTRSYARALERRTALRRPSRRRLARLRALIEALERGEALPADAREVLARELPSADPEDLRRPARHAALADALRARLERLERRRALVAPFDDLDIRYRLYRPEPVPVTQAVMFCLMDVSGSMGPREKELAKRFFMLLYLFLRSRYRSVDVVFIRHHTTAEECDEQRFFYDRETGGTIVSSCLELMLDIQRERYPLEAWNVYAAQVSDGDNWPDDAPKLAEAMERALAVVNYFAYIEVSSSSWHRLAAAGRGTVWETYAPLAETHPRLQMRRVKDRSDIWPVFRSLFAREGRGAEETAA